MQRLENLNAHLKSNQSVWIMKEVEPLEFFPKGSLKGKTVIITGASRGIGLAIGVKCAKDGKIFRLSS